MIIGLGLVMLAVLTLGMDWGWNPRRALWTMETTYTMEQRRREVFTFTWEIRRMNEAMQRLKNAAMIAQDEMVRAMMVYPADFGERDTRTFHVKIGDTA